MDARPHRTITPRMLVVSVVVGVVLAVASVPYGTLVREAGFRGWAVGRWPGEQQGVGLSPGPWPFGSDGDWLAWPPGIEWEPTTLYSPGSIAPEAIPAAARRHIVQSQLPTDAFWSGYPFKCAVGWWEPDGERAWLAAWTKVRHRTIVTPVRPIWLGLLGNTLAYSAGVFTPWLGLRALRIRRRRHRRKHGRCVACGYELGDGVGVCPECGLAAS